MDVAGAALALVVLRHERDRLALLGRDLLGGGLVDRVVVGRGEGVGVEEPDLVLAEVALALGALDVEAGVVHVVADRAEQRLRPSGPHDRVVDVVLVDRREVAVVVERRLLVRRVERDELELGAGQRGPAAVGAPVQLALEDGTWGLGDGGVVHPDQVALDHRRGREVGEHPDRPIVEDELHVAVAAVPRGDRVAVDGVHVDVDGEQVVAALGAVLGHVVDEVAAVQAFALEPPLHVGEGDDDGVDAPVVDPGHQALHGQVPVVAKCHEVPIPPDRAAARPCRRSVPPSRVGHDRVGRPGSR